MRQTQASVARRTDRPRAVIEAVGRTLFACEACDHQWRADTASGTLRLGGSGQLDDRLAVGGCRVMTCLEKGHAC
jgi:hypothetical protein